MKEAKALAASWARSFLAAGIAVYMAGVTDPKAIAHLAQYLQILIKVTPIESLWHNVIDVQLAFSLPTSLAAIAITNEYAFTYASPSLTV